MNDSPVEVRRGEFVLSTDRARLDAGSALELIRGTHWGGGMSRAVLERAMANSVCFGVLHGSHLVAFARVVTDLATYAYWTDVVVAPAYRGQGLGAWLSSCMLAHPELQGVRRVALLTRDAVQLYAGLGFREGPGPLRYMERAPSGATPATGSPP